LESIFEDSKGWGTSSDWNTKKFDNTKPEGKHRVGRQNLKWLDDVEADIKTVDIQRWRLKAQDRKEFTVIPREAEARLNQKGR
jgi:hypothetical protein